MKKRVILFGILIFLLFISSFSFILKNVKAHGGINDEDEEDMHKENINFEIFTKIKWIAFFIGVTLFFSAFFYYSHKQGLNVIERRKHIAFSFIVIVVSVFTLYILFTTIYVNAVSYSNGLVHWHADFTIEVCGKEIKLPESESKLVNRVGTHSVHHHNDNRMHVEGVLMTREEATLGYFFDAIGIPLDENQIWNYRNGDECNGKHGKLRVYVNDKEIEDFREYEIKHYQRVPPGDKIRIVFNSE